MSNTKLQIYQNDTNSVSRKFFGVRHIQFVLMFISIVIFYGQRTCMSVAVIAMTEERPPDPSIPVSIPKQLP